MEAIELIKAYQTFRSFGVDLKSVLQTEVLSHGKSIEENERG